MAKLQMQQLGGTTPEVPTIGREFQQMMDALHAPFASAVNRGNVYIYSTLPAGIALIVPATTGNHPTLWNPAGSGVNLSILLVCLSYASGTEAPTALEWARTTNAGAAIGPTGATILTFTEVAGFNALVGAPSNHKALWAPAVNTYTAAPVGFAALGLGQKTAVATAVINGTEYWFPYDGKMGVAPDTAISLCSVAATTTALYMVSIWAEEIPVQPLMQNA